MYMLLGFHCMLLFQTEMEAEANFLSPFNIYSLCQLDSVICRFVGEETNGSYPFANKLNVLAHLCELVKLQFAEIFYVPLSSKNGFRL